MLLPSEPILIMPDTNSLIQHLTGRHSDYRTIICDNGDIKINNFVLVSLYTILRIMVRSMNETDIILLKGMKKEDLLLLLERLLLQATIFEPNEQFRQLILSILTNKLDSEVGEEINKPAEEVKEVVQDDITSDTAIGFITEDHDYLDQEAPVIIKIQKPLKEGKKSYQCHICGKGFPLKRGYGGRLEEVRKEHLTSVHGFQLEKCNLCGIMCVELEKHVEKRHKSGGRESMCAICGKTVRHWRMKGHLRRHMKQEKTASEGTNEKKACQHCGKLVKCIRDHVRDNCRGLQYEEHSCQECGKVLRNAKRYRAHMRSKHMDEVKKKSLQCICNICGKVLSSKGALQGHHKAFHEIRELTEKCEHCGKLCMSAMALKHHIEKSHAEKESCPLCGVKVRKVKMHIESVHTKDEDKKFQCQDCGKGFMVHKQLEKHRINVHLKTRPYNCRYGCDISYNDTSNRNSHEKKTHGKLFTTVKEERLKEKIELLGIDEMTFSNPII